LIDRVLSSFGSFFKLFCERQIILRSVTPHSERLRQCDFQMIQEAVEIDGYHISRVNRSDIVAIGEPATAEIPATLRS
jgi:hypothetical protein